MSCCHQDGPGDCVADPRHPEYEPLHEADSRRYMHHVIVYECSGDGRMENPELEVHARDAGQPCYQPNLPDIYYNCNSVVVAWARGSEEKPAPLAFTNGFLRSSKAERNNVFVRTAGCAIQSAALRGRRGIRGGGVSRPLYLLPPPSPPRRAPARPAAPPPPPPPPPPAAGAAAPAAPAPAARRPHRRPAAPPPPGPPPRPAPPPRPPPSNSCSRRLRPVSGQSY
ncbi:MOXD1-like protein 2 [Gryllus bimaculatus]|nr:MOXD1-like protein 2 [Gryllus bimaculatus]